MCVITVRAGPANPTIANPDWKTLPALLGFGPWGLTSSCKVCAMLLMLPAMARSQLLHALASSCQRLARAGAAWGTTHDVPACYDTPLRCMQPTSHMLAKTLRHMLAKTLRFNLRYAWCVSEFLQDDAFPTGLCTLKRVANPAAPSYWSKESGKRSHLLQNALKLGCFVGQ